jgi:hypothetical protein
MSAIWQAESRLHVSLIRINFPSRYVAAAAALMDGLAFVAASCLAEISYDGFSLLTDSDLAAGLIAALVFLLTGRGRGLYKFQTLALPERAIGQLAFWSFIGVVADICLLFLQHALEGRSRGVSVLFVAYAIAFVVAIRFAFGRLLRYAIEADFVRGRRVVQIGAIEELERLTRSDLLHFGFNDVARFGVGRDGTMGELTPSDLNRVD